MLKVAIVGCGKIADTHAAMLQQVAGCEMIGACDREVLMAKQLQDRFPIKAFYSDIRELLEKGRPDVVHITTPPQTHYQLGKLCLQHGCHIYMEKPFTVNASEAEEIVRLATEKRLKITVGNDAQFTHAAIRFHKLVEEGYLGGDPIHMESYFCSQLAGNYARALLGDRHHWVRQLPGKLLHNIISHGVVRIAKFLPDETPKIMAHGTLSPFVRKAKEADIMDELRVIIAGENATAYFTFSSQMNPSLHQFRLYGPVNALVLDDDEHAVIKLPGARLKSYAGKFIPPLSYAKQYLGNAMRNVNLFLRRDFNQMSGTKHLIEAFYRSITLDAPLPISHREIVMTCRIMDSIFEQIYAGASVQDEKWQTPEKSPALALGR